VLAPASFLRGAARLLRKSLTGRSRSGCVVPVGPLRLRSAARRASRRSAPPSPHGVRPADPRHPRPLGGLPSPADRLRHARHLDDGCGPPWSCGLPEFTRSTGRRAALTW